MTRNSTRVTIGIVLSIACFGCHPKASSAPAQTAPAISVTNRQDRIELVMTVTPGHVDLTCDNILEIVATYPSEMEVTLPSMEDRLNGFTAHNKIEEPPSVANGSTRLRHRYLLTPDLAKEYRIAPAAIRFTDKSHNPPRSGWFPSPPIVLPSRSFAESPGSTGPRWEMKPHWIRPSTTTIMTWGCCSLLALVLIYLLWKASRRLRRQLKLLVMSPRDRALFELQELLAGDLLAREQFKEFYFHLTRIVRQFIERRHGIRAPEQTTEEFLAAISTDSRFPENVASRLRAFLNASDLVKFAAHTPAAASIEDATSTARSYIESDKPEPPSKGQKA